MAVIETTVRGGVGHIVLNRPEALNSLNSEMIRGIHDALEAWRDDDEIATVLVTSASPRAFCAGGDIKAIRQFVIDGDVQSGREYFAAEYRLNAVIAEYPKPYVALVDGAALGGGLGISIHGSVRVVTENAVLAMPESAIGFVPDVGSSFFLSRLPGYVGKYLGLTGTRVSADEALALGLATHVIASQSVSAFVDELRAGSSLDDVLTAHAQDSSPEMTFDMDAVNAVFSATTVTDMVELLSCGSPWSRNTKAQLLTLSPTSLTVTNALIERGSVSTLRECLDRELRVAEWVIRQPDFAEGVRAVLVDKDRMATWKPLVLEMVQQDGFRGLL